MYIYVYTYMYIFFKELPISHERWFNLINVRTEQLTLCPYIPVDLTLTPWVD